MMFIAGHVGRCVLIFVERDRQFGPIGILADFDDFFHRAGRDILEAARRLAQPVGERAQILFGLDAKRARLRAAVLHQDVGEPEAGLLDDVLE